jgi:hypothetical protein
MPEPEKVVEPTTIAKVTLTVTRGVTAGWIAGIPQVLLAQAVGQLLGVRERADIGPRFVGSAAAHAGSQLSTPMHWLLGAVFHFEYAAMWGALYGLLVDWRGHRRVPPPLGGLVLGGLVYLSAFSPLGAATRTGAERQVGHRDRRETVLHWQSALVFGLVNAVTYRWLRERW